MTYLLSRIRSRPRPGTPPRLVRRIGVLLVGTIAAGLLTVPPAVADEPAPIPLASVTATADDQLYALAADHSAVYRWNGKGTDWTKVGGPAQELYAGGAGLFATSPDKKIHHYSGQPGLWAQAGEAGKAFTVGTHLYGLAPDGNSVHQWSGHGTDWTALGAPSTPVSPPAPPQPTEQAPPPPLLTLWMRTQLQMRTGWKTRSASRSKPVMRPSPWPSPPRTTSTP